MDAAAVCIGCRRPIILEKEILWPHALTQVSQMVHIHLKFTAASSVPTARKG